MKETGYDHWDMTESRYLGKEGRSLCNEAAIT